MLDVVQIPVLDDNYVYLIHGAGQTAVVDPAVKTEVLETLAKNNWNLDYIINTHHHWDHTGANLALKKETDAKIIGYKDDAHRIPGIDVEVTDGEEIEICGQTAKVIFSPGHTLGHIVYYFASDKKLFCGDVIFAMGCGRLFEGSPDQMFESIEKLASLPHDTQIYCAHEYTAANAEFAITIEPENKDLQNRLEEVKQLRQNNKPTIPTTIGMELATNPFLRAKTKEEFAEIRMKKDCF